MKRETVRGRPDTRSGTAKRRAAAAPRRAPSSARLMAGAERARRRAYAPYSRFKVGAALLLADGTIVHGSNIENASYGLSVCAERTALWRAVLDGRRDFVAIAVAAGPRTSASPCGACRQVLHEFAPGILVIWRDARGRIVRRPLARLLADAFDFGRRPPAAPRARSAR